MLQVVIQKIPENLQEFEILAAKGRQLSSWSPYWGTTPVS